MTTQKDFKGVRETRVIVLYTGGTIGMEQTESGYQPKTGFLQQQIKRLPMLYDEEYLKLKSLDYVKAGASADTNSEQDTKPTNLEELAMPISQYGVRILYYIKEYVPIKDSSNLTIDDWVSIALDIKEYYDYYHGIVVIHGTDTMAYTASALSFMLENLGKTVILTGSQDYLSNHRQCVVVDGSNSQWVPIVSGVPQVPIYEQRNDGRDNLLGALMIAGHYIIPEVGLYFNGCFYRGNRSTKVNAGSFSAFDSPNLPPLIKMTVKIDVQWDAIFRCNNTKSFTVHEKMNPNIGLLRLFPGITADTVKSFLQPPMRGVVLQTYGAGNAPNNREDLITEIKKATDKGVIIVNCTQCIHGPVIDAYATGRTLIDAGVVPGSDMTPEAALTKLSYVLGKEQLTVKERQELMKKNLRGELTVAQSQEQFSLRDNDFIEAVASSLHVGSSDEMKYIRRALLPVLMCCAASSGGVSTLQKLLDQGADPNGTINYDGRTPLHIACLNGNLEVARYLLLHGSSVHVRDRFNRSPLDDAVKFRHHEVVKLLRETGAILGRTSSEIAAEICCLAAKNRVDDLYIWSLAAVDMNASDYDGRTPLHVAVCRNNLETVKFILDYGVDPTLRDIFGHTALDNAKSYGFENIINLFDEHVGLKLNAQKSD